MLRAVAAVVAGLAAATLLIGGTAMASQIGFIADLPAATLTVVLLGWGLGTFAGTFVAARVARSAAYGFVIGGVIVAAAIASLTMAPQPGWMWLAGIVIVVVTAFIAVRSAIPARKSAT